jgi:Co/Zn/Cd efflux system component
MKQHHHKTESHDCERRLWASADLNLEMMLAELNPGRRAGSLSSLTDLNLEVSVPGRDQLQGAWQ